MGYTGQHKFDQNTIMLNPNMQKNVSNLCQVHKLSQILLGLKITGIYHEKYWGGGGGGDFS